MNDSIGQGATADPPQMRMKLARIPPPNQLGWVLNQRPGCATKQDPRQFLVLTMCCGLKYCPTNSCDGEGDTLIQVCQIGGGGVGNIAGLGEQMR